MKIKTEHIKEKVREFIFTEPADSFPVLAEMIESGNCSFTDRVDIRLSAGKELDHYRVEGLVTVPLRLECSRCLCTFETTVNSRFTIFFREGVALHEEDDEIELDERDIITTTFSGDELDLMPEIGEQIALEIPFKPICSELCKGLCQSCGADLNTRSCDCVPEVKSSKFAALQNFRVSR